ncbi:MAG: hypothetical protein ACJ8GW_01885, partial [Massilia sp.]
MRPLLTAFGRALRSQLTGRMLLLSAIPFVLSLLLWGGLLYVGLEPLREGIRQFFDQHDTWRTS